MTWRERLQKTRSAWTLPCVAASLLLAAAAASAQDTRIIARHDSTTLRWHGRSGEVLGKPITVRLVDERLVRVLRVIAEQGELRLSYSSDIVPLERRVTIVRERTPAGDVLMEALSGTGLDFVVTTAGYVVIVRAPGAIASRVTAPREPIATSDSSPPVVSRVAVRPQLMDRVLVMGTPAWGAPERELASAVTVLTAQDIAKFGPASMEQLFRTAIPGIVAWDLGISSPLAQVGSVRGSSSFTSNYLKTYVDGVELASPYLLFAIDPYSVERIEVIRGPQGSALYGSDAISGVVQVVTRKGAPGTSWKPRVDALLSGGHTESRFVSGGSGAQRHSAMASAGGGATSLGFGGTYEDLGPVVPGASAGYRGTFGGLRRVFGPLRVEGSMRYADIRFVAPANPLFEDPQLLADIRPLPRDQRIENETYAGSLDFQPTAWWRQTLVVGIDRHAGAIPPQREPATVADALLGATRERVSKSSIRYSTSFSTASATSGSGGTLTLGVENARLLRERLGLQVDIQGVGRGLAALYADEVNNRGVFGHVKLSLARTLFLTGGLRGEDNDTFGERYGTAWSPMIGGAFTRDVGPSTLKFRLAYGKGIRAPAPSMRRQISTFAFRQMANPNLEPETQSGVEGGVEVYVGDRASIALTRYNQYAEGLIQQVVPERSTADDDGPAIQYQNVGRIQNSGWELEGTGRLGWLRGDLTFSMTDSRVRAVSSNYTGHLVVGDRVPEVPSSSGLASVTLERWRTQLTLGASYIGSWRGYDWKEFYEQLGSADAPPTLGAYLTRYKSLTKPYLSLTQDVWRGVDWFVRVENLTNVQLNERDNVQITPGRTATLGVRIGR